MEQTCERCGTFAVLESNGFRALCAPCWKLARHPIETRDPSLKAMASNLARLVVEFGGLVLLLNLVEALPRAAMAWTMEIPRWLSMLWTWGAGTATEVFAMALVMERALGGRRGFRGVWALSRERYLSVLGVNIVAQLAVAGGMFTLCVPGLLVGALLTPSVAIAVFEKQSSRRALVESVRRSWRSLWRLGLMTTAIFSLSFAPAMIKSFVLGWFAAMKQTPSDELLRVLRLAPVALGVFTRVPSLLFQIVAWSATRPAPPDMVPPPASI